MPTLQINKDRFMSYLEQFSDDIPYEAQLIKKLFSQMPDNYASSLIEELFYSRVYVGDAFIIQHYLFKDDIHYATSIGGVREFLKSRAMDDGDYIDSIDGSLIDRKAKKSEPICGFYITRGVLSNESRRTEQVKVSY